MLPGGLCSPARKGMMLTPDSSYDWRSFGERFNRGCMGCGSRVFDITDPDMSVSKSKEIVRYAASERPFVAFLSS